MRFENGGCTGYIGVQTSNAHNYSLHDLEVKGPLLWVYGNDDSLVWGAGGGVGWRLWHSELRLSRLGSRN